MKLAIQDTPTKILYDFFFKKCSIYLYDPYLSEWKENKHNVNIYNSPPDVNVDLIIFATPHKNFKKFNFNKYVLKNKEVKIFDLNNIIPDKVSKKLKKNNIFFKTLGKKI